MTPQELQIKIQSMPNGEIGKWIFNNFIEREEEMEFLNWLHDPKCPFCISFNGIDKSRDRICYEKNAKHYNIEQVREYWKQHKIS